MAPWLLAVMTVAAISEDIPAIFLVELGNRLTRYPDRLIPVDCRKPIEPLAASACGGCPRVRARNDAKPEPEPLAAAGNIPWYAIHSRV